MATNSTLPPQTTFSARAIHKSPSKLSNIMPDLKFFLDTGALIALSGLKGSDLQALRSQIEASDSELSTTHVQVDEITKHIKFHEPVVKGYDKEVQSYQQKIKEALKTLERKGINVRLEATKITVVGVSRVGYTKLGYEEMHKFDDELRKEIDECEKAKGKTKTLLNIARDTTIAVSSLGHDFFITCDRCLFKSWRKVIGKHIMLRQKFKIPKIVYVQRSPKNIAKEMLALLP